MNDWKFEAVGKKQNISNAILIEGLPGIGNVGKITADFLVEELKAKKIYDIFSYKLPHSVFVNEDNLVDLPSIALYHKKVKNNDILILIGDIQPIDEESCYSFCDSVLDLMQEFKCKEIVTLGGIGLHMEPKKPQIYCTGTSKEAIKKFSNGFGISNKLFGVVGPIIGVSGLLIGLAKKRKIDAVALLAETSAHPMHIGIKGAGEILSALDKKYKLGINLKDLNKEIEFIEKDSLKKSEQLGEVTKKTALQKLTKKMGQEPIDYIG